MEKKPPAEEFVVAPLSGDWDHVISSLKKRLGEVDQVRGRRMCQQCLGRGGHVTGRHDNRMYTSCGQCGGQGLVDLMQRGSSQTESD
jgi:hypothetical protein